MDAEKECIFKCRRKLFCLRLQRLTKLLQNYKKGKIRLCALGRMTYNALINRGKQVLSLHSRGLEDFETLSFNRHRIMCMMWVFLTQHKFVEAAKLMVFAIHNTPMSHSWIWRATYQIFNCMKASILSKKFNK